MPIGDGAYGLIAYLSVRVLMVSLCVSIGEGPYGLIVCPLVRVLMVSLCVHR